MRRGMEIKGEAVRLGLAGLMALLALAFSMGGLGAQATLADYDYENLAFRGFSLEAGYIFPSRVEATHTLGIRVDLGYLGPGLRIVPGIAYWSSAMEDREVRKLEGKVNALVEGGLDPGTPFDGVDLGKIDWSDLILSLDGHFVWSIPYGLLSYAGAGLSAHILNGEGRAISGTFVEDLLDSLVPGLNLHAGLEYPVSDGFRLYGVARYEIMEDLRYPELRLGGQIMLVPPTPGEERAR